MNRYHRNFLISLSFFGFLFCISACVSHQPNLADDTNRATEILKTERASALSELSQSVTLNNVEKLIDLGLWEDAESFLQKMEENAEGRLYLRAKLYFKKHSYHDAEKAINRVLNQNPKNKKARLLKAELEIQAWRLENATKIADNLLQEQKKDAQAAVLKGKILLLERNYEEALIWAKKAEKWKPNFAEAYLLEAETHFWSLKPDEAEPALKKALEINPFNADARFSYGYAIWRRVDATQLNAMAAQWSLALEVNPLHYMTHWHFGNGHTHLTYADYAQDDDEVVREKLKVADSFVSKNQLEKAIEITNEIEKAFPKSVLPAMMRSSIYYMAYDWDRTMRLDSAEAIFSRILEKKHHYGPAHNAMAAVIKQKQFTFLDEFADLERKIEETPIPSSKDVFYRVFRDSKYYPGNRVFKMIAQQIGPSKAYLEMIDKFNSNFSIPPLHIDLAIAMNENFFRYGTTFDNRQWMDIRGVGSGATGIEYLERGSHLERNVLAHEYAHLYHGTILTDEENRQIRALYHQAMIHDNALDYYAANNESEYFAQGYAGYLSLKKVHPLNHKSMNTNEYVKEKDPSLYRFIEELVEKQNAYLAGDKKALADNWAQTYVSLSNRIRNNSVVSLAYLDSALTFNKNYLPAILGYASIYSARKDFRNAEQYLNRAKSIDANFAPIYLAEANLRHEEALSGKISFDESINKQTALFAKANDLEEDLAELAKLNRTSRTRFYEYGHFNDALQVALEYLDGAPTISTYLRDRKNETEVFVQNLRSLTGFNEEPLSFFENLVAQNPQNFSYRLSNADALIRAKNDALALKILEEGQRILVSAGNSNAGYQLRIALIQQRLNQTEFALETLNQTDIKRIFGKDKLLHVEILSKLGLFERATKAFRSLLPAQLPTEKADYAYTEGIINSDEAQPEKAIIKFTEALRFNPYHLEARLQLIRLLEQKGEIEKAQNLKTKALELGLNMNGI